MHCGPCRDTLSRWSLKHVPQASLLNEVPESLANVLCSRCGSMLSVDPERELLVKLSQLSQFGLGADDRRLFATSVQKKS